MLRIQQSGFRSQPSAEKDGACVIEVRQPNFLAQVCCHVVCSGKVTVKNRDAKAYLKSYPELARRWINQCVACQRMGYKPEMPEDIYPGLAAQNLRKYFEPLELNEAGLCEECFEAVQEGV